MIILSPYEPKLLLPVPKWNWREPSLAQPKDQFGRQNRTRFRLELWKRDGGLVDRQWFDDRDEFDAALWRVIQEPYADIVPMWATVDLLFAPTGSNQTYDVRSDWNNGDNSIECIGGGGGGGLRRSGVVSDRSAVGGGGGGYGRLDDATLTAGGSATYRIAALAAAVSTGSEQNITGNAGNDTWFNNSTFAGAPVGGGGGQPGIGSSSSSTSGRAGGSGLGSSTFTGGASGSRLGGNDVATGGGGGAGRFGNGVAGQTPPLANSVAGSGGAGDNGSGGAGGVNSGTPSSGDAGTEMDGIGAGGGGSATIASDTLAGSGGNYGAGGGGAATTVSGTLTTAGAGAQGAIIITYTPLLNTFFLMFN